VLGADRAPLSFTYGAAGEKTVLFVTGGAADPEGSMDPLLKRPCGTESQGILIQNGQLKASRSVNREIVVCPSAGMDEKMFWMVAHERED
jgi:hypothetical protein